MARPPQTRPTKAEIASYYRTLKSAAKGGDVLACAELIKIDLMERHYSEERSARLKREFDEVKGDPQSIVDSAKAFLLDAIDQHEKNNPPV